ncbi:hypothetical protein N1851_013074 [Merluccius polli]|uniref:Uncharacterized protein n=1 Tax=Merluccius polli TaxID=89951 RepID=A0AA47P3Y8_MERPO|nr:hypothetical protein N1851_013074 [Merluccius polli]
MSPAEHSHHLQPIKSTFNPLAGCAAASDVQGRVASGPQPRTIDRSVPMQIAGDCRGTRMTKGHGAAVLILKSSEAFDGVGAPLLDGIGECRGERAKDHLVCDTILVHAKERFSFTQHLISATLLHGELFPQHNEVPRYSA